MTHSTLTSKGETTIPLVIRIAAGIQMGAKLSWSVTPDGVIRVNVKRYRLKLSNKLGN